MAAPAAPRGSALKDVIAYVEVWSANGTENYSKTFTNQLVEMGAKVSKTFNKQVTHVVFKDGHQRTWDKARARGVKLVSVLWVEKCRTAGVHVDEALFPAPNTHAHLPCAMKKKHKCMQPKDFVAKTPENDKRLQKKFEKMASEMQRQKTTQDNDVPVFSLESASPLTYSPTLRRYRGQHRAMEQRLREMKESRENLSPTSSQMIEKSHDTPVTSCEASLNISHDTLCSDSSFAAGPQLCPGDYHGSPCGSPERKPGGSGDPMDGDAWVSAPALLMSSPHLPPPGPLGLVTPQKPMDQPAEEEATRQSGAGAAWDKPWAEEAATVSGEQGSPSPLPAAQGQPWGPSGPRSSSAKRRTRSQHVRSPVEGQGKRQRHWGPSSEPRLPWLPAQSVPENPDPGASPYDDYFSPENLQERSSKSLLPEAPPPRSPAPPPWSPAPPPRSPAPPRARAAALRMSDFSCLGKSPSAVDVARFTADTGSSPQKRPSAGSGAPLRDVTFEVTPAEEGRPGCCGLAAAPGGSGRDFPRADLDVSPGEEQAAWGHDGDVTPPEGGRAETRGSANVGSAQKEDTPSRVLSTPAGESRRGSKPSLSGGRQGPEQCVMVSEAAGGGGLLTEVTWVTDLGVVEEEPGTAGILCDPAETGRFKCPEEEGVKNGSARCGVSEGPREACKNRIGPREEAKKARAAKPTRTLVMTSMPSEKQNIILRVVAKLRGFSLAREVCESTTHVLVGQALRTLNVLLGLARGCWILSFEWVLWSLELGHWVPEEPFELFDSFPAAPLCRRERHLSAGPYQGTLFAGQPTMFISPASSAPRAKLWELVRLCGGRVTEVARRASICIGPPHGKKKETVTYLSEKWILDSVTQHRVCAPENYLLPQ
ncbi:microcephalin [Rhynchonycteris naso]